MRRGRGGGERRRSEEIKDVQHEREEEDYLDGGCSGMFGSERSFVDWLRSDLETRIAFARTRTSKLRLFSSI